MFVALPWLLLCYKLLIDMVLSFAGEGRNLNSVLDVFWGGLLLECDATESLSSSAGLE